MLLLRIFLILAILAGIGVIVVSQVVLKPQIEGIIGTRDENKKSWDAAEDKAKKLAKNLKDTQGVLKTTQDNLETTKSALAETSARADSEQKRANALQVMLDKVRSDLKTAQDDLAAYVGTGYKPNEIKGLADTIKSQQNFITGLTEENKLFAATIKKLQGELLALREGEKDPIVPSNIRGHVLVVDPKWNFLVLDVGEKHEVPQNGVLLVSRDGVLVAKVRVMTVQKDRSIANIMPGWKLKDVLEGDFVLPY